jgi:hypothetical protein
MDEVLSQFGGSTPQRQAVTARLRRIYQLASATGKLTRLVILGSYVTIKPHPNGVVLCWSWRRISVSMPMMRKRAGCSIIGRRKRSLRRVSSRSSP